jgi:hypothetical protein
MGERSAFGAILERAALDREWCPPNLRDMHDKDSLRNAAGKPIGHYGEAFGAARWRVFEEDGRDPLHPARGYMREVWGARAANRLREPHVGVTNKRLIAAELARNVTEVLGLISARLRLVALTQHQPRAHGEAMRFLFGCNETADGLPLGHVRIAHLSLTARESFLKAERAPGELTLYSWLEGVALRVRASKARAGERAVIGAAKNEMSLELAMAYAAYEEARARRPKGLLYPYQSETLRQRRAEHSGAWRGDE